DLPPPSVRWQRHAILGAQNLRARTETSILKVQRGFARSAREASQEEPSGEAQRRSHIAAATHEGPDTAISQRCAGQGRIRRKFLAKPLPSCGNRSRNPSRTLSNATYYARKP
ncbi:unnamed protein product, partial [Ascophyllum nodosum]